MNRRLFPALLLLIFGYVIPASCQLEPVITYFSPQTLAWTNQETNTYCDIEWLDNLEHEWVPFGLNLQATQTVTSIDLDIFQAALAQIDFLFRNAPEGMFVGRFFRVVASEQPIQPRSFTNALRLVNVSTSVLTSVTLGLKQGWSQMPSTNFPSVPPMATTDMVCVWAPYPATSPPPSPIIVPIIGVQNGWFVSYDHDGSNRVFETEVMPVGPVEKNILLTVSNNSLTIDLEWLRLTQTRPY